MKPIAAAGGAGGRGNPPPGISDGRAIGDKAEAAVQRARKPVIEFEPQDIAPPRQAPAWREERTWPFPLRVALMVGAGAACWGVLLLAAYWLIGW